MFLTTAGNSDYSIGSAVVVMCDVGYDKVLQALAQIRKGE
jgi:hypothetical protein